MGLQEEFDKLYEFTETIEAPLGLVEQDWLGVVDAEAAAVAALPIDDWDAYLDAISYTFADDRKPSGLVPEAEAAWYVRCAEVRSKALLMIRRRANEILDAAGRIAEHVASANTLLQSAKAAYVAGDTWTPGWMLELVVGVWHGREAGGSSAFDPGADRTLFLAAQSFLVSDAERALTIFDDARESWPSDAAGLSEYRQARAALAEFVGA